MPEILIRGMEMPTDCYTCRFRTTSGLDEWMCMVSKNRFMAWEAGWNGDEYRHTNCPLVELPEHGDLIERNPLVKLFNSRETDERWGWLDGEDLLNAPVIVPGNKEESE